MSVKMKKKGLAVAVILLFVGVASLPSITAHDMEINDDTTEPLDVGRILIRGFGFIPKYSGDNITFFAIKFQYPNGTILDYEMETIWFRWITVPIFTIQFFYQGSFFIYYIWSVKIGHFEPPDNIMRTNNQMRIWGIE